MKAVVAAFNQEKALVEAFLRDYALRMELFEALISSPSVQMMNVAAICAGSAEAR